MPLGAIDIPSDILPWRLGVVLQAGKDKAVVGLRPSRQQDGTLTKDREAVEITLDEVKWAKIPATKATPKAVTDILAAGDVIYIAPKDPRKLDGVWSLMQIPEIGGGLVAMDPHTGRVLAVAGGFSFAMSQFDRVIQAKRQPGSSFKPFVYAAALDNGYKPTSIILDAPIEIDQGPGQDIWKPENYDKEKSFGPTTLRVGVEKSRNQMTVRLAQDVGMPIITEYAKRFGIYDDLLPVLSMSLGAGETTLLRMATAYCMLANGGKQVRATLIDRIQDRWGRTVWKHDARECVGCAAEAWDNQVEPEIADDRKQIIDPHTAYQMTSILEGRRSARHGHRPEIIEPADRRQDRHDQRRARRLVRRLHARSRCRRLYRLRHATPHGQGPHRRRRCGSNLRRLHETRVGRRAGRTLPRTARTEARPRQPQDRTSRRTE